MCNDLLDESSAIDMVLNAFFMGNYEIKHFYSMKIARGPLSMEITLDEVYDINYLAE